MLADKINYYEKEKKFLQTTPAQYKDEFEWLKQMNAYALCNEQMNLQTAFNNFFRSLKVYRNTQDKLAREQRKLSKMIRGSHNYQK